MNQNQVFLVGGAVRDAMLGLPVHDRDFVVVGATVAAMESAGFRPVGKDFPVFLHPQTHDEYALARTERKSGQGYRGFTVFADQSVTLEDDLARRDLTINAIAQSNTGDFVDPYGGQRDLANKVLRHVRSDSFIEDPVRVLRLARFYARFSDFTVSDDTMQLVKSMVEKGDLDHLVAERVWQEMAKGLMEKEPQRMFEFLRECGALKVLMPELDLLWGIEQPAKHHPEICTGTHVMMVLNQAAQQEAPLEVRFAALVHDLGKGVTPTHVLPSHHDHESKGVPLVIAVCERLRVPAACRDLALMVCAEHTRVHVSMSMKHSSIVSLFERVDALRRPERFFQMLQACECDAKGRLGLEDQPYPQKDFLIAAFGIVKAVDAGAVAKQCKDSKNIATQVHAARVRSLSAMAGKEKAVAA